MKKVVMKTFNIIRIIITILLIIMLAIVILQRTTKNNLTIGNFYIFQVVSGSMEPEYKIGDLIVVKKQDVSTYKVGDDVTYKSDPNGYNKGIVITHRIIKIDENNGKYTFTTQGIANDVEDPKISGDMIYGKVLYHSIILSFLGRLMQNNTVYYGIFVIVGLSIAFDLLRGLFVKDSEEDEEPKKEDK